MFFARLIGLVPLGIGLTLLAFLWLQPFDGFGSPPMIFRLMGSFVALFFILQGSALVSGALGKPGDLKGFAKQLRELQQESGAGEQGPENPPTVQARVGYQCTSCAAPLASDAEVSPHGDVKCAHCGKWFNIHKSGA